MRHLIVVCLAFMMGLNVACSRVEDLGKDDLHSEPTIEIVSGDTLDIVGFTLAHELATSEGRLPYNVGDEFGYTGSYTYKSYVVRTEYTYQDDGNSIWVWEDTLSSIIGFYPYLRSEVYDLADVQFHLLRFTPFRSNYLLVGFSYVLQFHIRSCAQGGSVSVGERTDRYDTALLHIIRSANGEDMDVWIPCKPSELRYRCVVYHLEE